MQFSSCGKISRAGNFADILKIKTCRDDRSWVQADCADSKNALIIINFLNTGLSGFNLFPDLIALTLLVLTFIFLVFTFFCLRFIPQPPLAKITRYVC
jgi:uncharacterized membrane protein YhdT